jgi:hypothetical protein
MPLPGILASQISGHLFAPSGAYDALATVIVPSGGAASISFTGIPTEYKHLQIRMMLRKSTSGSQESNMQFNGDTGTNYDSHYIIAFGSGIYVGYNSASAIKIWYTTGNDATANAFSSGIIDILDYQNTNKYKTTRTLNGQDLNGSGEVNILSGLWMNTNAINSITLSPLSGNYVQYSQAALYGVK